MILIEEFIFDLQRFDAPPEIDGLTYNSEGGYYEIKDAQDLVDLATYVNGGKNCDGLTFKLTGDIDMSSFTNFTPIGGGSNGEEEEEGEEGGEEGWTDDVVNADGEEGEEEDHYFSGTFDGDGHTISNLTISNEISNNQGLFGNFNGTVKNVTLKDAKVSGNNFVGGLVGINEVGTIKNSSVEDSTISDGKADDGKADGGKADDGEDDDGEDDESTDDGGKDVGGLVGSNSGGTIENCFVEGSTISAYDCVGGLVGSNEVGTIEQGIASNVTVTGNSEEANVGGLVGYNSGGTLTKSLIISPKLNVNGDEGEALIGGLVGYNNAGQFENNYYNDIGDYKPVGKDEGGEDEEGGGDDQKSPAIEVFAYNVTLPEGVEVTSGAVTYKNVTYYATNITLKSSKAIKDATDNDDGTYSLQLTGDTIVNFSDGGDDGGNNGGDETDKTVTSDGVEYNKKTAKVSTSATITSDFENETYDATQYRNVETIKVAGNFSSDIEIIGNSKANKITSGSGDDTIDGGRGNNKIDGGVGDDSIFGGGTGNDTLTGGKGYDIFVYDGKGKDKITDFTSGEDTVSIDGELKRASVSGNNVVFKVGRAGTLTLDKAVGKKITYTDANNEEITETFRAEGSYNEDETTLDLFSTFSGKYDATKYKNLETIDGSAIKDDDLNLNIVGNDRDNSITGGKAGDSLSGGKGSDTLDGGKGADYIDGGVGDDSLFGGYGGDTLRGGTGDDTLTGGSGKNIFVYESGDDVITDFSAGNNRIQLLNDSVTIDYEISGSDLIFDFTGGSLTIEDYDGEEIKFLDANGNESEYILTDDAILNSTKTRATIVSSSYTADDKISQIDGSQVDGANITGNWRNNSIIGSSGNDTLTGGGGKDTFIYSGGNDIIIDYESGEDKIQLLSGSVTTNFDLSDNDLTLNFDNGSLTIQNYDGDAVKFLDEDGKSTSYAFADDALLNSAKTRATLTAGNYTADKSLVLIDGSQVGEKLNITGNAKANLIIGNDIGGTLIGGGGNDYFWGGNGLDTFIFNSGDGRDAIYNFDTANDKFIFDGLDWTNVIADSVKDYGVNSLGLNLGGGDYVSFRNLT